MPSGVHHFVFGPCPEKTAEEVRNVAHVDEGGSDM